jgi:hypothetical protein
MKTLNHDAHWSLILTGALAVSALGGWAAVVLNVANLLVKQVPSALAQFGF